MPENTAGDLAGQVALVTGAASGIGAATARRLARDGAAVAVSDINGDGVKAVAEDIVAAGGTAMAMTCDQTDVDQVAALFADVAQLGRLDICVANAGWGRYGAFLDISLPAWQKTFDVNVTGTFLVCQSAARRMVELGRGGSIVVTSSCGAVNPVALFSAYCSAKAALNTMVTVMAYELGQFDIRANAVMPGVTETAMTEALLDSGARDYTLAESPLGRNGKPEDVADAIAFLAGPHSGFVTGSSLLVDGGASTFSPGWFGADFRERHRANWTPRHVQWTGRPS
ncbi:MULTISPECIES: SDR family NAD(P)-dependent oxidoreductase [Amycolatopsis]|uniref:SDR family NAD(P)-dependent oxidoreductase n=1 Tax=Amycolatopsis TaxID=1813 RepID=UPI000B8AD5B4|nr:MULTISPECIES: SDR family NAD(P)-dependent oxidoreductase [Amycolatopsis]OXM67496.1 short-chain dehydrogenase [Amycolatopsis sp. KNN50.9b]